VRIAWATDCAGVGDAYGHTLGNRLGREAAAAAGMTLDPDAEVALHHCPPHAFQPISGKVNVLWAAWEFAELLPPEIEGLRQADVILATARFLVEVFEQASGVPTFYVPQGVRTGLFAEVRRRRPRRGERFRYLWVGAPNDRKGWRHVLAAWRAFEGDAGCELYLKTTFARGDLASGRFGNVIVDTRDLGDEAMRDLYHSAHCFVFPSLGEGFGFTMAEAMSTGLPCVFTPATALADLADASCGYPVRYAVRRCFEMGWAGGRRRLPAASADIADLAGRMREVRRDYAEALRRGHLAACRMRERFTWEAAGRELRRRLEMVGECLAAAACQ